MISAVPAFADTYDLVIDRTNVRIDGQPRRVFSINGPIAGPTLRWSEGEEVAVNITNRFDVATSIHWHGIIAPFWDAKAGVQMVRSTAAWIVRARSLASRGWRPTAFISMRSRVSEKLAWPRCASRLNTTFLDCRS